MDVSLDEDAEPRANQTRYSLDMFELEEGDLALLDSEGVSDADEENRAGLPVLAIVGCPNIGKSTLVNRITGRREAVAQDTSGVTRDRVSYSAEWVGTTFIVVDTGGWEADVRSLDRSVIEQAEIVVDLTDTVLLVPDATVGVIASDERIATMLRSKGKPVVLAANKVDSPQQEADAAYLWSLGMGELYPVPVPHGRGTGDLLDAVLEVLPEEFAVVAKMPEDGPRRVTLLGRPNTGKSSLLSALAGSERVVVNELVGTTRDPVDELVELDGESWWFVDIAGIRRKMRRTTGADYYASTHTRVALEKVEAALVLLSGSGPLTEQDIRVMQTVVDVGRALVTVNNKWDLVDEERQLALCVELERELAQMSWAPCTNLPAKISQHTNRITRALRTALEGWEMCTPTGQLNAFLGQLVAAHPHPLRGGKQPRILFGTQMSNRPPKFVLFTMGFLGPGYRRFIERRLREEFGFEDTPIQTSMRVRERKRRWTGTMLSQAVMDSPVRVLLLIASDRGFVRIALEQEGFGSIRLRVAQVLDEEIHENATALLDLAKRQLTEYFVGERQSFDLPLDRCLSSGFFVEVQTIFSTVPFGETMSYLQLAAATGHPKAHRAAANARVANPLPFIQACHRITRSDGTLGGYRGGVEAKHFLLDSERRRASSAL